jgi:hypothetical protein
MRYYTRLGVKPFQQLKEKKGKPSQKVIIPSKEPNWGYHKNPRFFIQPHVGLDSLLQVLKFSL